MNRILNKISNKELISIIEESLIEYCYKITQNTNKLFKIEKSITWVKTFPNFWPNFILSSDFENDKTDNSIQEIITRIKNDDIPSDWLVGPKSNPKNLCNFLEINGFTKKYSLAGMAIDLTKLSKIIDIPQNVRIELVDNNDLLIKWTEIVSKGLFNCNIIEFSLFKNLLKNNCIKFYIAYYKEEAVATSMLEIYSDVAVINMVATLPTSRHMGIGTVMTLMPLLEAYNMGYYIGVLHASQAGESIYKKIGFEEYCKFNIYTYNQ